MLDVAGFVAGLTGDPPPGPLTPGSASARPNSSESHALRAALPQVQSGVSLVQKSGILADLAAEPHPQPPASIALKLPKVLSLDLLISYPLISRQLLEDRYMLRPPKTTSRIPHKPGEAVEEASQGDVVTLSTLSVRNNSSGDLL